MQEHGMDEKNLDIYGDPTIPWSRALDELENIATTDAKKTFWLATTSADAYSQVACVAIT